MNLTWDPQQTSQPAWHHHWRIFWLLVWQTPAAPGSLHLTVQCASPKQMHTDINTHDQFKFPSSFVKEFWGLFFTSSHLSSSTTDCLNHHRVPYLGGLGLQSLIWLVLSMVAANDWHPSSWHDVFRCTENHAKQQTTNDFCLTVPDWSPHSFAFATPMKPPRINNV